MSTLIFVFATSSSRSGSEMFEWMNEQTKWWLSFRDRETPEVGYSGKHDAFHHSLQTGSISLRSLILHAEHHDLHRFFSPVLFLFQMQTATAGFPGADFLPSIALLCWSPTLHDTTRSSHPALPFPGGPCHYLQGLVPIKSVPGKSDWHLHPQSRHSKPGSADAGPSDLPFLTQLSRLATPTPHPSSRGIHSVFSYVHIFIRWDSCFVYPGDFNFLIFKVALHSSTLLNWF